MSDSTTPQDAAAMSPASTGSVEELLETIAAFMDQTDRFKGGSIPVVTPEATNARVAFFRLRKLLNTVATQLTLTEAERRAVGAACNFYSHECETDGATDDDYQNAAALGGLLERLG